MVNFTTAGVKLASEDTRRKWRHCCLLFEDYSALSRHVSLVCEWHNGQSCLRLTSVEDAFLPQYIYFVQFLQYRWFRQKSDFTGPILLLSSPLAFEDVLTKCLKVMKLLRKRHNFYPQKAYGGSRTSVFSILYKYLVMSPGRWIPHSDWLAGWLSDWAADRSNVCSKGDFGFKQKTGICYHFRFCFFHHLFYLSYSAESCRTSFYSSFMKGIVKYDWANFLVEKICTGSYTE